MFTTEEILSRLAAGETADAIAASFTESLNAAIQQAEEQKSTDYKNELANNLLDILDDYYATFHPKATNPFHDIAPSDIVDALDCLSKYAAMFDAIADLNFDAIIKS